MATTTDAVMADTVPTVLESARYTAEFLAVVSKLVWNIRKELHDGKNVNIPVFGTVSARNLTEGVDNTVSETMSDTLVTITPGEVGCKIILTDKLVRDNQEDIKAAAGRLLGNAMEVKRDQDITAQFLNAGTTFTGNPLTLGVVAAARAILKGNPVSSGGPAPGNLVIVNHPYVTLDVIDIFTPLVAAAGTTFTLSSDELVNDAVRNYGVGKLFGMPWIEDGNIDTTSVANSAVGCVFNTGEGSAFVLATANEWSVEPERDASLRATELNITGEYGVGVYEADWAAMLRCDATLPA